QQAYKDSGTGRLPPATLIKAILINSADDVGPPGIHDTSGYGNLNALKATEHLLAKRYYSGTVSNKDSNTFSINVPPNIRKLKCTLVWQDPPGAVNGYKALVNDLDLQVQFASLREAWNPWVLNTIPDGDSLALPPVRKRDS